MASHSRCVRDEQSARVIESREFPSEMLGVATFEHYEDGTKIKLTLHRNHAVSIAKRYQKDQGWSQSLDRFAEILAEL